MKPKQNLSQSMQRAKVGMIGLAAIVLFIGLAGAIIGSATRERPVAPAAAAQADAVANMAIANNSAADRAGEPLAEMGVAPSANVQDPAAQ